LIRLNYEDKQVAQANQYLDKLKKQVGANNPNYAYLEKLLGKKRS